MLATEPYGMNFLWTIEYDIDHFKGRLRHHGHLLGGILRHGFQSSSSK